VQGCENLRSLDGLGPIASLSSSLTIRYCRRLQEISDLEFLQTVNANVTIEQCDSLSSLHGLEALNHIGRHLYLIYLTHLIDLDALSQVDHIWGSLIINNNWRLTSLEGLWGLQANPATGYVLENLSIAENSTGGTGGSSLGNDTAWELVEKIGGSGMVEGTIEITGN
jgi:hypothetical protein